MTTQRTTGNPWLKLIAFVAGVLLFFNIALFPILWGMGSLFLLGQSSDWIWWHRGAVISSLVLLGVFCLSTQWYLATRNRPPGEK